MTMAMTPSMATTKSLMTMLATCHRIRTRMLAMTPISLSTQVATTSRLRQRLTMHATDRTLPSRIHTLHTIQRTTHKVAVLATTNPTIKAMVHTIVRPT